MVHFIAKLALALLLIAALILLAASRLAPGLAAGTVLLWAAAGVGALLAVAAAYVLLASALRAWLLRHGAIDTQWLWFSGNPPSFERLYRKPRQPKA